jgi:hypothetical protein
MLQTDVGRVPACEVNVRYGGFIMKLKFFLAAASLAILLPMSANAATVTDSDYTDDFDTDGATNLSDGPLFTFNETFVDGPDGGVIVLDFLNDLDSAANLYASASVNAIGGDSNPDGDFGFGGDLFSIGDSPSGIMSFSTLVGVGDTVSFYSRLGDITGTYQLDIQFLTAEVPVPAAGFLLIGALGGLVAVRRRKA